MGLEELGVLVGVALVASALARGLSGYSPGGFIVSTAVGFIGALFGLWLQDEFQLPEGPSFVVEQTEIHILWALAGAGFLVAVLGALTGRRS